MNILNYVDQIAEYQNEMTEYHAWENLCAEYKALPWYKKLFTKNPNDWDTRKHFPTFHWNPTEFSGQRIGDVYYSIKLEVRAYNGEFFVAMAEETPYGIQGCKYLLDGSIEGMLGKFGHTREADRMASRLISELNSILLNYLTCHMSINWAYY